LFHNTPAPLLEYGSIGWEDEDEYIFPGDDENDGHTLVRVQLFRGRDTTKPLSATRAQGMKLLAHINSLGGFRTPPKDTRCMVAVPAGMEQIPGAAIITAIVEQSSARFDNLPNGSVSQSAGQGQARVVTNNDGSISLFTTNDNTKDGKSVYVRVATDAIQFVAPWGTVRFDDTGFHVLHSSGASFDLGGIYGLPTPLDALTSYVKMQAASIIGTAVTQMFGTTGDREALVGRDQAAIVGEAHRQQALLLYLPLVSAVAAYNAANIPVPNPTAATQAFVAAFCSEWAVRLVTANFPTHTSTIVNGMAQFGKSTSST